MRIIKDIIWSALQASFLERAAVEQLLTEEPSKGSFLRTDNLFYTGLVDYVTEKFAGTFDIEVEDRNSNTVIPIQEIVIPPDFVEFPECPGAVLRPYQVSTAKKAIFKQRGIIEMAPGAGKTDTASAIIKYLIERGVAKRVFFVRRRRFSASGV